VGQVAAVLLTANVWPIKTKEVLDLPCSDGLKLSIRRAIGEPWQRFVDAATMAKAFQRRQGLSLGRVSSLKERTVVFTGPLRGEGLVRADATRLACRAGARVIQNPSASMDVLVVGDDSPTWIAGTA